MCHSIAAWASQVPVLGVWEPRVRRGGRVGVWGDTLPPGLSARAAGAMANYAAFVLTIAMMMSGTYGEEQAARERLQQRTMRHRYDRTIGDERAERGGLLYTPMRRRDEDDERTMGYGPGKGLHVRTTFWTYNCQMMNRTRAQEWSEEMKGAFVMMQGTQATYDVHHGERHLQYWSTDYHDVWEAKKQKRRGPGCQPEGVAVFAPKGMNKITKGIWTPKAKELEGRAIAVHFSSGEYDVCCLSLYCPVCSRDADNRRKTEKLWDWVRALRTKVGRRTTMIIGADANGKVGSVRKYSAAMQREEEEGAEDGVGARRGARLAGEKEQP